MTLDSNWNCPPKTDSLDRLAVCKNRSNPRVTSIVLVDRTLRFAVIMVKFVT